MASARLFSVRGLERLVIKHNLGNATLGREIIREYLARGRRADLSKMAANIAKLPEPLKRPQD